MALHHTSNSLSTGIKLDALCLVHAQHLLPLCRDVARLPGQRVTETVRNTLCLLGGGLVLAQLSFQSLLAWLDTSNDASMQAESGWPPSTASARSSSLFILIRGRVGSGLLVGRNSRRANSLSISREERRGGAYLFLAGTSPAHL